MQLGTDRRGLINMAYLPPEWRAALAGYESDDKADATPASPVERRKSDIARNRALGGIVERYETYYPARLEFQPDLTQGRALRDFCRQFDGLFGRRLRPDTLRRWVKHRRNGGEFKETRGWKRGSHDGVIGMAARARFLGEYLRAGVPFTVAYEITAGEALRNAGDPAWSWPRRRRPAAGSRRSSRRSIRKHAARGGASGGPNASRS